MTPFDSFIRSFGVPQDDMSALMAKRRPSKFHVEAFGLNSFHGRPISMRRIHSHAEVELNFIESGSVRYQVGGEVVPLKAGTLAVFSAATAHELIDDPSPATRYFWITVPIPLVLDWNLPAELTRSLWRGRVLTSS